MFRKSKASRASTESGSREADDDCLSPVVMSMTEQAYAPATKFCGGDQMVAHFAIGLRIRTGLGVNLR